MDPNNNMSSYLFMGIHLQYWCLQCNVFLFFSLSENGFTDSQLTMHYYRLPNKILMWMIILYKDKVNFTYLDKFGENLSLILATIWPPYEIFLT